MKAMIFAAGMGTRLKPLTDRMPKALVPLAGKPLLQWQVEKLRDAGITDIIVNVHHFADMIIEEVEKNKGWGTNITISDEREKLLDTGGGLWKVTGDRLQVTGDRLQVTGDRLQVTGEDILVCNVDILSNIDIERFANRTEAELPNRTGRALTEQSDGLRDGGAGWLVVSERETQRYLCFDEEGCLCGWTNVKTGELKGMDGRHLAYSGMAILTPQIWPVMERVAKEKGEVFSMIDVFLATLPSCHLAVSPKLRAYIPDNYRMMDVGKIDQIKEAETFAESLRL